MQTDANAETRTLKTNDVLSPLSAPVADAVAGNRPCCQLSIFRKTASRSSATDLAPFPVS